MDMSPHFKQVTEAQAGNCTEMSPDVALLSRPGKPRSEMSLPYGV